MVVDRWHLSYPQPGDTPCKCGRGANKLYPSADHKQGKRWQVRWDVTDEKGVRRQPKRNFTERFGDDPERHAEAFDAKVRAELDAGTYIDPAAGQTTLKAFGQEWRSGLVANPSSLENYDRRLAHIYGDASAIAGKPMAVLAKRPASIQQWVKSLERAGLDPAYIKQIFDMLSSIFIAAIDNGVCIKNPTKAQSVRLPKVTKRTIVPWTADMVAAARDNLSGRRIGSMVDLGAGSGLRQGEIFGVAEEDIVFLGHKRKLLVRRQVKRVDRELVFAPPKGDKEREVPLSDALGRRLAAQIKTAPPVEVTLPWGEPDGRPHAARLLFVRKSGLPYHRQGFGYIWAEARAAAGADPTPENGMHILRHTYASVQLAALVDVLKVAAWLGHSNPSFTWEKYAHFIPDTADAGRAAVDAFLEPGPCALDVPSADGR